MKNTVLDKYKRIKNLPKGLINQRKNTLYIDPRKIELHSRPEFYSLQNSLIAQVRDGDWDLNYAAHAEEDFYISLKQFIVSGEWESTPHYKRIIKEMDEGSVKWGCSDALQFKEYLNNIVKMMNHIKVFGYDDLNSNDRVEVNISRDGKYFLNTGRHRLAIAKILGIEKIPVNINTIHANIAPEKLLDKDYALFIRRRNMEKYVDIDWTKFSGKTVLDIGPAFGIWSVLARGYGATVKAMDIDEDYMRVFRKVTEILKYNIPLERKNVLELDETEKHDIVIFMAVWHHIPQKEDCLKALDKIFSIATERLFLEGPVSLGESRFQKQKKGPAIHHDFYWIPSVDEITREIESRGGRIKKAKFQEGRNRMFLEVECGD